MIAFDRLELILYRVFGGIFVVVFMLGQLTGQTEDNFPLLSLLIPTFYLFWTTCAVAIVFRVGMGLIGHSGKFDWVGSVVFLCSIVTVCAILLNATFGVKG